MSIPQRIAAVPAYIASNSKVAFTDAAPGHKFLGYFRNWQGSDGEVFAAYKGKARLQGQIPNGPQKRAANELLKNEFDAVLNEVCELPKASRQQIEALRSRQKALIAQHGVMGYRKSTMSIAPFATGLGNEHLIENGFAFLTPYGLPYLPGSGVKGILRRSMQELCRDGEVGFADEAVNALFGPEKIDKPSDARRGAIDCWDVFPNPAGGRLVVEIMTPHHGGYYQQGEAPHDSGSPVPVSFLAVPAKSEFDFHVVCQSDRLTEALRGQWRELLDRAFAHAFEWVGFGAKTSVGYGAMAATATTDESGTHGGSLSGGSTLPDSVAEVWSAAKLTLNPGTGEITASFEGNTTAGLRGADAEALRSALGEERLNKLKKKKELKEVAVVVEKQANSLVLKGLACT